jgi:hypothetical protein
MSVRHWMRRSYARRPGHAIAPSSPRPASQSPLRLDGVPVFGVSVFVAHGDIGSTSERTILSRKLRRYPSIYRTTVGRLLADGFDVLPTFAAPHFTVLIPSLDAVDDLAAAFGNLLRNPYAEA